jgi:hypothetical protein
MGWQRRPYPSPERSRRAAGSVSNFSEQFVQPVIRVFGEADALETSGEAACGGDSALSSFVGKKVDGSKEADGGGNSSGDEGEVGGVAGLADALMGDFVFNIALRVWVGVG